MKKVFIFCLLAMGVMACKNGNAGNGAATEEEEATLSQTMSGIFSLEKGGTPYRKIEPFEKNGEKWYKITSYFKGKEDETKMERGVDDDIEYDKKNKSLVGRSLISRYNDTFGNGWENWIEECLPLGGGIYFVKTEKDKQVEIDFLTLSLSGAFGTKKVEMRAKTGFILVNASKAKIENLYKIAELQ